MEIHVLDVYGFLHTADSVRPLNTESVRGVPVGGIHYIMRKICAELLIGNSVVCCFDGKGTSDQNRLLAGYKANRKRNPNVAIQADLLYDILRECNVPCYRGFGEADDHIYSIVEQFKPTINKFDYILLHTSDYDICHNVDEGQVKLLSVNNNTNNVSYSTFSDVLFDKSTGFPIKFNTISAYKVFCGDSSDNIKALKNSPRKGLDLYKGYLEIFGNKFFPSHVTRNKDLLISYIKEISKGNPKLEEELLIRVETIYPKDLRSRVGSYSLATKDTLNSQLLSNYCVCLKDFTSIRSLKKMNAIIGSSDMFPEINDKIYRLGIDFKNGVYHCDNNIPMEKVNNFSAPKTVNVRKVF